MDWGGCVSLSIFSLTPSRYNSKRQWALLVRCCYIIYKIYSIQESAEGIRKYFDPIEKGLEFNRTRSADTILELPRLEESSNIYLT